MHRSNEWIEGNDIHTERARAAGNDAADAPETYDAERLSLQFDSDKTLALPMTQLETAVCLRNAARQRDQKRDRVFSGGDRISIRSVHDNDAARSRSRHIDVVHAHARAPDHAQILCVVNQFGCHFCLTANNESRAVSQCFTQFQRTKAKAFFNKKASTTQRPKPLVADVISHKNFDLLSGHLGIGLRFSALLQKVFVGHEPPFRDVLSIIKLVIDSLVFCSKEGGMVTACRICVEPEHHGGVSGFSFL